MNRPILSAVALLAAACFAAPGHAQPAGDSADARLGINLNGPRDYNTELPFVDVFRMARPWISQREGAAWGKGPELALDEHGYVTRLDPGAYAESPVVTIDEGGHYPAGEYTLLYEGTGKIGVAMDAELVDERPGRATIRVKGDGTGFHLQILETDPDDYIRNIRIVMPGFEDTYADNPFHPRFLERWRGMAAYRFMDWMHTNGSEVEAWDDRPKMDDMSWWHGIPPEVMVDLANRTGNNAWFCMPHLADDGYVRSFAELVKGRLDPSLNVYVEYSNEVWNNQFDQTKHAQQRGQELGLADKPWAAGWLYYAKRSGEIIDIWKDTFGEESGRVVGVLASQAANPFIAKQILGFEDVASRADALAIAPYISFGVHVDPKKEGEPAAEEVAGWTPAEVVQHMVKHALPESVERMRQHVELARQHGLELIAYEAGQHAVGVGKATGNDQLTEVLTAANALPEMGVLYTQYLNAWESSGGGLMMVFTSVSRWSKWGSWGLTEYYDEDPMNSPKYRAVIEWARDHGQDLSDLSGAAAGGAARRGSDPSGGMSEPQ